MIKGIRVSGILLVLRTVGGLLAAMLLWSGLRFAWAQPDRMPAVLSGAIDSIAATGTAHMTHLAAGVALLGAYVFYLTIEILRASQTAPRQTDRHVRQGSIHRILWRLVMILTAAVIISGAGLYAGVPPGLKWQHIFQVLHFWATIPLIVIASFAVVASASRTLHRNVTQPKRWPVGTIRLSGVALALALSVVTAFGAYTLFTRPVELLCKMTGHNIIVDGRAFEIEWAGASEVTIPVRGGFNFFNGLTSVTVKALRSRRAIYFLVQWHDPDRSANRHLIKTGAGWVEERTDMLGPLGEGTFAEDELAISFHTEPGGCTATCHFKRNNMPNPHKTKGDTADIWRWRSVSTDPVGQAEDGWWDGKPDPLTGGQHVDNKAGGGYFLNLNDDWMQPYLLPSHWAIRDFIDVGSSEAVPYLAESDGYAVGDRIPAVLVSKAYGDVGDVVARGRWVGGLWTVEFSRRISTGSDFDVSFNQSYYLGIAPFDNADKKHAYHLRPIHLVLE